MSFTLCTFTIPLLFFAFWSVQASAQGQEIASGLTALGFENVSQITDGDHLLLRYENNVYRFEAEALSQVLKEVEKYSAHFKNLSILILHNDLPISALRTPVPVLHAMVRGEVSYDEWLRQAEFTMETDGLEDLFQHQKKFNRNRYKLDLPIGLGMRYQLGNRADPYQFAFDLLPELRMSLGKGLTTSARFAFPLYNNYDVNTFIRPDLLTLTKDFTGRENLFVSVSAGFFTGNRTGVHARMKKYFFEEVLALGIEAGYTTFSQLTGKVDFIDREDRNYPLYTTSLDYRWRKYDLNMQVKYGNFLYQDQGVHFEVYRQFGEVWIGFFYLQTNLGENMGFRFTLPIAPGKYSKPNRFRIRPARHFSLPYRSEGNDLRARIYKVSGNELIDRLPEYYPSVLSKELNRFFGDMRYY